MNHYNAREIYEVCTLLSTSTGTVILTQRQMEIAEKLVGINWNNARDILFPLFKEMEGDKDEFKTEG